MGLETLFKSIINNDVQGFMDHYYKISEDKYSELFYKACINNNVIIFYFLVMENLPLDIKIIYDCFCDSFDNNHQEIFDILINNIDISLLNKRIREDELCWVDEKKINLLKINNKYYVNELLKKILISENSNKINILTNIIDKNLISDKIINTTFLCINRDIDIDTYSKFMNSVIISILPDIKKENRIEYRKILTERITKDKYYGLINSNEMYVYAPDLLLFKLMVENPNDIKRKINYLFNNFSTRKFKLVINSEKLYNYLINIFKYVENIKSEILLSRKKELLLMNSIDTGLVYSAMNSMNLDELINNKNISDKKLIKFYKNNNYYIIKDNNYYYLKNENNIIKINRKLKLFEIIMFKNYDLLYDYYLNGGDPDKCRTLILNRDEKKFVDNFKISSDYHEEDKKSLLFFNNTIYFWNYYINNYRLINKKLKNRELMTEEESDVFNNLSNSIISCKKTDREYILYKSTKTKDIQYIVGEELLWPEFTHCYLTKCVSEIFIHGFKFYTFIILIPKESIVFVGKVIESIKDEVILPPNSLFDVKKIKDNNIVLYYKGYRTNYGDYIF